MSEHFNVVLFWRDGRHTYVVRHADAQRAVEAAASYTRGPGALTGAVQRVIITDGGDNTNFEWKFGEGITFPPEAKGKV